MISVCVLVFSDQASSIRSAYKHRLRWLARRRCPLLREGDQFRGQRLPAHKGEIQQRLVDRQTGEGGTRLRVHTLPYQTGETQTTDHPGTQKGPE